MSNPIGNAFNGSSWYDYIPVVGNLAEYGKARANGQGESAALEAGADPGGQIRRFGGAVDSAQQAQLNGYLAGASKVRSIADQGKAFELQGLQQAENYYLPAQQRLNAAYGAPGSAIGTAPDPNKRGG